MENNNLYKQLKDFLNPHKKDDKDWFLSLLDEDIQKNYEDNHIKNVMLMLRVAYINALKLKIKECRQKQENIKNGDVYDASKYVDIVNLDSEIKSASEKIETFKCFFEEPYFARMDLTDPKEGYNSYYIGRKGDDKLEIVDWRAPLAKKYYQKSKIFFSINEYDYKLILRRALRTKNGKVEDFRNEYLSVKEYLSREEIDGRDEEILFDPYLRNIIKSRKDETDIKDIIETIQEKQFEIITLPERANFILQGCAGSGKTMILLHRLSYLMYNNEDIKSRDVLVITPSVSFNAFIDELANVLELEKVKTSTINDYFLDIIEKAGVDLRARINPDIFENKEYLAYIYSPKFMSDIKKKLDKVYDSVYGMLTSTECRDIIEEILLNCKEQEEHYTAIKNASLRVRRAVLGEIKEKKGGGLYYTKPFREFMNCILTVREFLTDILNGKNADNQSYFYGRFVEFYAGAVFVVKKYERIFAEALNDLGFLKKTVESELDDLKRYKYYVGKNEFYTYPDRIARREELLKEIDKISAKVENIGERCDIFSDFYEVLRGEKNFVALGRCSSFMDLVRFFYRDTVKKSKNKFGVTGKGLVKSDAYSICMILALLGKKLPLGYSFLFIDEGQDISRAEYELLKLINPSACFNVFGDLKQNITDYRGVKNWRECMDCDIYELNQNYRNTNQIVDFVSATLDFDMLAIGFDGPETAYIKQKEIPSFLNKTSGLKAIITLDKNIEKYAKKSYNILSVTGKVSKTKINVMTVYESKGLEFSSVAVDDEDMSANEKYIAYTRALMNLAVIDK